MGNFAVFTPGPTYTDTGTLAAAGAFIDGGDDAVKISGRSYDYQRVSAPGVAGQGTVALGYRSRRIELRVVYVDITENGILGSWDTDITNLGSTILTSLVMGGITYYALQLDPGSTFLSRIRPVGLATETFFARAVLALDALRLS
ncbi:MAG TPA: hypothetical protein VJ417_07505 [Candidatus Glassbacteria bacterium]|nr:hypothetical protein [Candidatus Glassbacteria bacterium]